MNIDMVDIADSMRGTTDVANFAILIPDPAANTNTDSDRYFKLV